MSMFEQMRDNLLTSIEKNHSAFLRAVTDAEKDTQTRFDKMRKDAETEREALLKSVYETCGKPDDNPNVPEAAVETVVT